MRALADAEQLTPAAADAGALGATLGDLGRLRVAVARRRDQVVRLADGRRKNTVPLLTPAGGTGGHAVLVHVTEMPEFRAQTHPQAAFLHHLYRETGIRGGIHCTGLRSSARNSLYGIKNSNR
jgi:tryptophanase